MKAEGKSSAGETHVLFHMGDPYDNNNPCTKRIRVFLEKLKEEGYRVTVLAPGADSRSADCSDVICCPTVRMKRKTSLYRFLYSVGFAVTSFWKVLAVGKVHIVLTTSPPPLISLSGWLAAKVKGAKLVYDVRDIWPDIAWEMGSFSRDSIYSRVFGFIRDFMLRHADLVTAVSAGKVEKLQGYVPGTDVIEIPNGLDEEFLENTEDEAVVEQFRLDEQFSCVYIGNLGLAQGLGQLLSVAQKAKQAGLDVRFFLYGKGVEEERLRRYVQEHRLDNVIFAGCLPNRKIYTVLRHARVSFVSLVNGNLKDSVPTKLYEALGAGCPVLLAAAGDAADILNDCGLGIAVPPGDEDGLWKAFLKLYREYDSIVSTREHARKIILEKYTRQKAAEQLEKRFRAWRCDSAAAMEEEEREKQWLT